MVFLNVPLSQCILSCLCLPGNICSVPIKRLELCLVQNDIDAISPPRYYHGDEAIPTVILSDN